MAKKKTTRRKKKVSAAALKDEDSVDEKPKNTTMFVSHIEKKGWEEIFEWFQSSNAYVFKHMSRSAVRSLILNSVKRMQNEGKDAKVFLEYVDTEFDYDKKEGSGGSQPDEE